MTALMLGLARLLAYIGGAVLTALVILTTVSVTGRGLNTLAHSAALKNSFPDFSQWLLDRGVAPINGDFELVEMGVAFAIFAFLPLCQIYGGHATVDIFTSGLPKSVNRLLKAFWEVVFAGVLILITQRLYVGFDSKFSNNEITYILQIPVWWGYLASLIAAVGASLVGIYCAVARLQEVVTGKVLLEEAEGVDH